MRTKRLPLNLVLAAAARSCLLSVIGVVVVGAGCRNEPVNVVRVPSAHENNDHEQIGIKAPVNEEVEPAKPAETPKETGTAPAAGSGITFDEPAGITYAAGKLYVADTNNHAIRTIDLEGRFSHGDLRSKRALTAGRSTGTYD